MRVQCKECSSDFSVKPSQLKLGFGIFCSQKCHSLSQRRGKFVFCHVCKKQVWRMPKELNDSKSKNYFCSKSCQTTWRNRCLYIGSKHKNWRSGKSVYRQILLRNGRTETCKRCGLIDRRVLAVHHVDKNRQNNDVANLLWLCHNCHYLIHHDTEEMGRLMVSIA